MRKSLARIRALFVGVRKLWQDLLALQRRERVRLQDELSATQRLMPLLMKQRNGAKWSADERRDIRAQLRRMVAMSPYLVLFVMPGGLLLLPLLAWWLDRRRQQRDRRQAQPNS